MENQDKINQGHEKVVTIVVNTRDKEWSEKEISYRQVVELAFPNSDFDRFVYTVSYSKGIDKKPKGTLADGQSVHVKDGMIFDVERANKS